MKISRNAIVMSATALTSAAALFAVLTTGVNAGERGYGEYKKYGYGPAWHRPMPPARHYNMPQRPPMRSGYRAPAQPYPYPAQQSRYGAASSSAQQNAAEEGSVMISNMRFEPSTIRVKAGEEVSWLNNGPMPHTVTGSDGAVLASSTLGSGASFSYTFDEPGSYEYYCSLHPSMQGTVIVE